MTDVVSDAEPREAIRAIALGVFDAIDEHPWVRAQLAREPWQSAMLQIFEGIGGRLQASWCSGTVQFHSASALVNYILGVGGQNAANARLFPPGTDRGEFLGAAADRWRSSTPPSTRSSASWRPSCANTTTASNSSLASTSILAGIATVR